MKPAPSVSHTDTESKKMLIEIPAMLLDAGLLSAGIAVVAGGIAVAVLMIDYAYDRVKE